MAVSKQNDYADSMVSSLEKKTRGNQIGIYTIAGLGLAFAFHKVRPISKYFRAKQIPKHIINNRETLRGKIIDLQPSPDGPRLLFDHRPLIRIPLWHSSRPPLPLKIWGVNMAGGNGFSWLQVVAVGREASISPVESTEDGLVAHVTVHWPKVVIHHPLTDKKTVIKDSNEIVEDIELGEKLVELGMARVSNEVPQKPQGSAAWWWLPWIKEKSNAHNKGHTLQRLQDRARSSREGFWGDIIPLSPFDKIYLFIKSYLPEQKVKKSKPKKATPAIAQ